VLTTSYHTHSRYCDGRGEISEYAAAAVAAGLQALGVTSHSPVPFPEDYAMRAEDLPAYCADVLRVRQAHQDRLQVHLALEFDYLPEFAARVWETIAPYPFDYLIGSVHFVGVDADGIPSAYDLSRAGFEQGLDELFGGNIRRLVTAYYDRVRSLIAWGHIAVLGHLDRIKMWNKDDQYFGEDTAWYRQEIETTLQACARTGVIVELNTSGWRHAVSSPYPSPWVLRRCLELDIPIVVTTDAHHPTRVAEFRAEAEDVLRDIGCRELAVLRDDAWIMESVRS